MNPVLKAAEIRKADAYTINNEPIESINLMERASSVFAEWFCQNYPEEMTVRVFCGCGNNGGDGLAIARLLSETGRKVDVVLLKLGQLSPDASVNLERWQGPIHTWEDPEMLPDLPLTDIAVDALFGSGLSRPLQGLAAAAVMYLNASGSEIVAVDCPSGIYTDGQVPDGPVVSATRTLSFEFPKAGFLMPESGEYAGRWETRSIGIQLPPETDCATWMMEAADVLLPDRSRFMNKGKAGHIRITGGESGKQGAVYLAAKSALRTGSGLVTVALKSGSEAFNPNLPEVMHYVDSQVVKASGRPYTEAIGPGLGTSPEALEIMRAILSSAQNPVVLDADALNLLAMYGELWDILPNHSILTPHPGELGRLFPQSKQMSRVEHWELIREKAALHRVIIVLKGAYTVTASPESELFLNSTGNPGLATAGSGDALTGIVSSLLGQGLPPLEAAKSGVYLHGLAADLAAAKLIGQTDLPADITRSSLQGFTGLLASDIANAVPLAMSHLRKLRAEGYS